MKINIEDVLPGVTDFRLAMAIIVVWENLWAVQEGSLGIKPVNTGKLRRARKLFDNPCLMA